LLRGKQKEKKYTLDREKQLRQPEPLSQSFHSSLSLSRSFSLRMACLAVVLKAKKNQKEASAKRFRWVRWNWAVASLNTGRLVLFVTSSFSLFSILSNFTFSSPLLPFFSSFPFPFLDYSFST